MRYFLVRQRNGKLALVDTETNRILCYGSFKILHPLVQRWNKES